VNVVVDVLCKMIALKYALMNVDITVEANCSQMTVVGS